MTNFKEEIRKVKRIIKNLKNRKEEKRKDKIIQCNFCGESKNHNIDELLSTEICVWEQCLKKLETLLEANRK